MVGFFLFWLMIVLGIHRNVVFSIQVDIPEGDMVFRYVCCHFCETENLKTLQLTQVTEMDENCLLDFSKVLEIHFCNCWNMRKYKFIVNQELEGLQSCVGLQVLLQTKIVK